jgi:hypothetical protein
VRSIDNKAFTNFCVSRSRNIRRVIRSKLKSYLDGKTIVLATEDRENLPTGWRAREPYEILGADEFVEVFENLRVPAPIMTQKGLGRKRTGTTTATEANSAPIDV